MKSELLSTEGTAQYREVKWQVVGDASTGDMLKLLNDKFVYWRPLRLDVPVFETVDDLRGR